MTCLTGAACTEPAAEKGTVPTTGRDVRDRLMRFVDPVPTGADLGTQCSGQTGVGNRTAVERKRHAVAPIRSQGERKRICELSPGNACQPATHGICGVVGPLPQPSPAPPGQPRPTPPGRADRTSWHAVAPKRLQHCRGTGHRSPQGYPPQQPYDDMNAFPGKVVSGLACALLALQTSPSLHSGFVQHRPHILVGTTRVRLRRVDPVQPWAVRLTPRHSVFSLGPDSRSEIR